MSDMALEALNGSRVMKALVAQVVLHFRNNNNAHTLQLDLNSNLTYLNLNETFWANLF